jgi:hypothetical protein
MPCADYKLLVPLKRSREHGAVRKRVADLRPADAWQQEGFHFFVFELHIDGNIADTLVTPAPLAVFAMHPEVKEPLTAVVVTPSSDGAEAEIRDLREPDSAYTAPIAT